MKKTFVLLCVLLVPVQVLASGYGVFTQGASGLGQANAVVAHPTGPSSLYFNPALLNDVPGRQIEVGTTGVFSDRSIDYVSGGSENGDSALNFPSNFYYTQQYSEKVSVGLGVFFPFGLSNEWDDGYDGKFIGTSGEMFTVNINPVVSYRVNDRLSLAAGLDFLYLDTELRSMVNQAALYGILDAQAGPIDPPEGDLAPVEQKFTGDDWGVGYNLGVLFKATDRVSIGAAYRSEVSIDLEGELSFSGEDPVLALAFLDGVASTEIDLPAQFVVGVATQVTGDLIIEVGARWEDWDVNDVQTLEVQYPYLGDPTRYSIDFDRNWHSTWAYNIGASYKLDEKLALNFGYLYGENAVPKDTFEPIIPDSDAHLFTIGADYTCGQWTLSGAFGYEYHDERDKKNDVGDPLGSLIAGRPVGTANGEYNTDIYLFGLSLGYKF